ncbi:uncharacterized protein LOC126577403 isoform X2 [Anopheles aquasalis]|uniref:uncharacterized protein LOC126577403 isoform X1 n=1 Tax=Anopheles aquasalis TaxID=42839 RepID=UPI00215B0F30|nr:uncharacterized protein LOC126577403 isoform X1 [Anopheles aquasalis]XP_050094966.1 uncharacterized protein LOC126577403 isoform X2 [Anopheles aquasalis]
MNEMTSPEWETRVDSLPEEMLCMIFNHLDLWSVKQVSLTCRRWHDIVFLSGYIKRFKFQIDFSWASNAKAGEAKHPEFLEELIGAVNHTQRSYRNMHFIVRAYTDDAFPAIWKALHPKMTENVTSLIVVMDKAGKSTFAAVSESISLIPKLRSLSLHYCSRINYFTTLRHSSVQHLEIDQRRKFAFDMPELKSFVGPLDILQQAWSNRQHRLLTKLKHVTLTYDCASKLSVFDRLAALETLQIKTNLDEKLIIAIGDACTSLKELCLHCGMCISDPTIFLRLSNLVNLRVLKFSDIMKRSHLRFDIDLSKLTQLEVLCLGSTVVWEPTSLILLPESIRNLSIPVTVETEGNLIQIIVASLTQLQKLHLCYSDYMDRRVAKSTIKSLPHLKRLEELSFVNAEFSQSDFLNMEAPMPQLRTLRFKSCSSNRLLGLEELFPNLKDVKRCW